MAADKDNKNNIEESLNKAPNLEQYEELIKKDCENRVKLFGEEVEKLKAKYNCDLLASVTFTDGHKPRYQVVIAALTPKK